MSKFWRGWSNDTRAMSREAIYEYPLERWQDVNGSRLKTADFVVAAFDLAAIYWRSRAGKVAPPIQHRASSIRLPASRRGIAMDIKLYDEMYRVEQDHWWFRRGGRLCGHWCGDIRMAIQTGG